MTDKPRKSPSDEELRDTIAAASDRPGDLHDARILDAARSAAAERRAAQARKTTRLAPGLAVAATLLIAVSLTFVWLQEDAIDSSAVRSSALQVAPIAGAELTGAPPEFSWPAQAGATGYRLVVFDTQANEIWASQALVSPRLSTPGELSRQLEKNRSYLWLVEVDGDVMRRELGPFTFSVAGDSE